MASHHNAIAALALLVGVTSAANATPLVNTLLSSGDTSDTVRALSTVGTVAQSFVANSAGIGDVELQFARTGSTTGSLVITIMTNASGVPSGTVVDTIATLQESSIPSTETLFDFYNISLTTPLVSGTTYWLDISKGSSTVSSQTYATTRSNTGSSVTSYFRGTGAAVTTSSLATCISDDNACDATNVALAANSFNLAQVVTAPSNTPEPASLAVIGVALTGIGVARRLKSARKSASVA